MKYLLPILCGGALAAACTLDAENLPPGQVDFGSFSPPSSGGEFVEVNLPANLIALAARFVERQEPEVAQLLKGLQQVHVKVIGVNDENRSDLVQRAQKLRKELESKGWEKIVTAQQQDQNVGVYLKLKGKDIVQGLTVVVMEGNHEAVFVNIVGDIKPDQLAMLGDRLHIDPLKKLGPFTEQPEKTEPAAKPEESETHSRKDQP